MANRNIRKAIQSLLLRIEEHQDKITEEETRLDPNNEVIIHWQSEIRAFTIRVQRLEARLARRRRRGR